MTALATLTLKTKPRSSTAKKLAAAVAKKRAAEKAAPEQAEFLGPIATIDALRGIYPEAFAWPPRPLAIGIRESILAAPLPPRVSKKGVRRALSLWCRSPGYLTSLLKATSRIDLDGATLGNDTAEGAVTTEQRKIAEERLSNFQEDPRQ